MSMVPVTSNKTPFVLLKVELFASTMMFVRLLQP